MNSLVTPFRGTTFHPHTSHNPDCDILVGHLDLDTDIIYVRYVKGKRIGQESMEYYRGENYVGTSQAKTNYSRHYPFVNIPKKYRDLWELLRSVYAQQHFLTSN